MLHLILTSIHDKVVISRCLEQYWQIFSSLLIFCNYVTRLKAREISCKIWKIRKIFSILHSALCDNSYLPRFSKKILKHLKRYSFQKISAMNKKSHFKYNFLIVTNKVFITLREDTVNKFVLWKVAWHWLTRSLSIDSPIKVLLGVFNS